MHAFGVVLGVATEAPEPNTPKTLALEFMIGFFCMTSAMGFFFKGRGIWGTLLKSVRFLMTLFAPIGVIATLVLFVMSMESLSGHGSFGAHGGSQKGVAILTGMAVAFAPFARHTWRILVGAVNGGRDARPKEARSA
jgi:hypothetical protein